MRQPHLVRLSQIVMQLHFVRQPHIIIVPHFGSSGSAGMPAVPAVPAVPATISMSGVWVTPHTMLL